MNHRIFSTVLVALLFLFPQDRAIPAAAESPAAPQYAPSREVDLQNLALDVIPDFRQRTIAAQATLRFKPIALPLRELRLDAVDLTVTNVTSSQKFEGWQVTPDKIILTFDTPIPAGREASVTICYQAQPTEGLFFRTRELGYPPEDEHLWTQGEAISARRWYPGLDSPNQKFTTELTCRVAEDMVVLSNGRKVSDEKSGGLRVVRWLQDKPHANYLVALVAGHFRRLEDRHRDIPLAFWTVPSESAYAASSFDGTRQMMAFFEQETGVPYPWARYDQVCVMDFTAGGMENTTLTVLNDDTLFPPETENLRNSQGLVAHELAHQWFGNLVTCKDWSQIWLNEGFATYYEHLYDEHKNGRDEFLYRIWQNAKSITSQQADAQPLVFRGYQNPDEMFDWRAYGKGAAVLHMLRCQLGPDLFRKCIRTYLERHRYGNVTTEDLNQVAEEVSGRSFDRFFDQWVYRPGTPVLEADYSWNEQLKLARLSLRQTQPASDKQPLFQLPVTIRFKFKSGSADRQVVFEKKSEDFDFPLAEAPVIVRVDPELALLARVTFRLSGPMLEAQLNDESDTLGRLIAIEQLQANKGSQTVDKLKRVLNHDRFYGMRVEAVSALRAIHTRESLDALLASIRQTDARVRRAVVSDIGRFYQNEALAALLGVLKTEKNPDIQAEAIQGLGPYAQDEARAAILKYLEAVSYQDGLAGAAIRALRSRQDPTCFEPLLKMLQRRDRDLAPHVLANSLDVLARLARGTTNSPAALAFLEQHTTHPRQFVRTAALSALGTLEDARALAVLETFASAAKDSPERKSSERAIETIRSARKVSVELGDLRRDVLELQKQNQELKRGFEKLQKEVEAASAVKTKAPLHPATRVH